MLRTIPVKFRQFLAEFIGTFFLIFIGVGSVAVGENSLIEISLAFGFVVAASIFALGNISGSHINPAVTISFWIYGLIGFSQVILYTIAQVLGAISGGFAILFFMGVEHGLGVTTLAPQISSIKGMLIEALATFVLIFTVYGSSVGKGATKMAGFVVGFTVSAIIFATAPLTDAALNPARALGPALVAGDLTDLWVYLVGPVLGGIVAAFTFKLLDVR